MRTRSPLGALAALLLTTSARAEEGVPVRSWSFVEDPTLPRPETVVLQSKVTYGATGGGAVRPFVANLSREGGTLELGAEVGVAKGFSLVATAGATGIGYGAGGTAVTGGVRIAPLDTEHWAVSVGSGVLREGSGSAGLWLRGGVAYLHDRWRVAGVLHTEKVFADGRDELDVLVVAGATYRLLPKFRAGIEYVAQDLEGAIDPEEAEGGVRHFIGPMAALELDDHRLTLSASPGIGLSAATATLTGRLSLSYAF